MRQRFHCTLSDRDRVLLQVLLRRVRVFSVTQAARTFWPGASKPLAVAARRLRELEAQGLLGRHAILAHPEIEIPKASLVWRPGQEDPDFGALAYRLQSRWTKDPVSVPVVAATKAAEARLGGHGGRRIRLREGTHELHLTHVYLRMLAENPQRAATWVSEAELFARGAGRWEPLPDAMVFDDGSPTVIEFGGTYSKAKLERHHHFFVEHRVRYELW